ncbi:class I SAM-dependent methyltransferase [uncultured Boseongicola sp.]|jgi:ubiquinone/menaquinone biosynthesis C-methylase UbiE|uniref:class I SAM-dependent DNA methyltransferase n=1 Tax=uncultured Boseongicola sp. TaxID=1648499 RepID=UPI0026160C96|nr:class I SAM-dependent methyltransferase [uncultured Boseongicola sp.]
MADEPNLDAAYAVQTPEDNLKLYEKWAETYDADFVQATTYRFPKLVTQSYVDAGGRSPCLDVGCGTGALGEHFPEGAVVDGLDLSPEMLAVAHRKKLYRNLIEADLKEPLDLGDETYSGLVSSGTFTHGHVGPEALPELVRVLAPGAVAIITVRPEVWVDLGFDQTFEALQANGYVSAPEISEERVYADSTRAPEGHDEDVGLIVTFRRL